MKKIHPKFTRRSVMGKLEIHSQEQSLSPSGQGVPDRDVSTETSSFSNPAQVYSFIELSDEDVDILQSCGLINEALISQYPERFEREMKRKIWQNYQPPTST